VLIATFPNGRKVRAIILDSPKNSSVTGAVECCLCNYKTLLDQGKVKEIADSIERFALTHKCKDIKEQLLEEIVRQRLGK